MKKRSLILSTALLLVAIMACTSATYAWFTSNSAAKVNNISASVDQRSSLQISSNTNATAEQADQWENSIDFVTNTFTNKKGDKLNDLSSVNGTSFVSRSVDENDNVTYSDATDGFIEFSVSFLSSADGTLYLSAGEFGSATKAAVAEAARIAFITNETKLIWEPTTTAAALGAVAADPALGYATTSTNGELLAIKDTTGAKEAQMTTKTTIAAGSTDICDIEAGVPVDVIVRIWLEGQDCSCVNSITNITDVLCNMTFAVA